MHANPHRRRRLALVVAALLSSPAAAENPAAPLEAPTVEVVATMPLAGIGAPKEQVPAAVQAATGAEMARQQALNLPEFMSRSLAGVHIVDTQANPFQPDVLYRGFNASPLLGAAQGLSVYLDGVRVNEPFGDVVNWDLIPQSAISTINLVPGSNPLFGLNTLGGALSVHTKSGREYPGSAAQVYGGSFNRRAAEFEHGGRRGTADWFVTGNWFKEDGWRDFSPSEVRQLFAKAGVETEVADLDVSLTLADNEMTGNGLTPSRMLSQRREQIYTFPDTTDNELAFLNVNASRWLDDSKLLSANAYYRALDTRTFNGDLNEVDDPRFGVVPYEGGPDDVDNGGAGLGVDAASNNRSRSRQRGYGFSVQLGINTTLARAENRFAVGAAYDHGRTRFRQSYQLGVFTPERGTIGTGVERENVSIDGRTRTASVYASDTFSFDRLVHVTLSGRYNQTRVRTIDEIAVPFPAPALGLDNDFTYRRFNPAVGVTYTPSERVTGFASFSQGSRAPSPVELGCSDPNSPCRLPNAMASDPFLEQVIARTGELGVRGRASRALGWNAGVFRTDSRNDILFVSVTTGGAGFFQNFGRTRRQGIEAGLDGEVGRLSWRADYSYVEATFESTGVIQSENNSTRDDITTGGADDDQIRVTPGNRIPGVPRHNLKLSASWRASDAWTLGGSIVALSSQYVRGNENNRHQPGTFTNSQGNTRTFVGSGTVPGYAVLNLNARYRLGRGWQAFARVDNVLDRRYRTSGMLGENAFPAGTFSTDSDAWVRDTFYAPGAPRAGWIGLRFEG